MHSTDAAYSTLAIIFFIAQIALGLLSSIYDHVFTRDSFMEYVSLLLNIGEIWLLGGVGILLLRVDISVRELLLISVLFADIDFFVRQWNKKRHVKKGLPQRQVLIIANSQKVRRVIERLSENKTSADHRLAGILLLDDCDESRFSDLDVPVFHTQDEDLVTELSHLWLDDAFLLMDEEMTYPKNLMENFLVMGISIHVSLSALDDFSFSEIGLQELGSYKVITNSVRFVSDNAMFMKRLFDIVGGLVGTLCTGIIFLFIAPLIYIKSPGPIFFAQPRVGLNGRTFLCYKFRSMYMDAEKRKAELMAQNKIQNGMMFKMDDDPRIIGSEKKDKNGKPKGIGNFIRNTSLDEFPQFWNVLKGDMSLVGPRPERAVFYDQFEQYIHGFKQRLLVTPGISGLAQVSGGYDLKPSEKIIYDIEYIKNQGFLMDLRVIFKTFSVLISHDGAR
mgnify:CR=1 FL=1